MPCLTFQTFRKLSRLSGNFIFYKDFQENLITSDLNMIFVGGLERCPPGGLSAWRLVRLEACPQEACPQEGCPPEACLLEGCPQEAEAKISAGGVSPGGLSAWRRVRLEACPPGGVSSWRPVLLEACPPGGLSSWRRVLLEACPPGGMSYWRLVRWRDDCQPIVSLSIIVYTFD